MNLSKIPQTDLTRPVTEELLDEIQARLNAGWRIRNDMQILVDFAREVLSKESTK